MTPIEAAAPDDAALLALNNAHAVELSLLTAERFAHLVERAFLALRVGTGEAFLLAFDQDAAYDSANFLWFRARYERFVYLDRVVVAQAARGRGLARRLHGALATAAAAYPRIVCEVNRVPANPASDALHESLGFRRVGSQVLPDGKTVRYLERALPADQSSR